MSFIATTNTLNLSEIKKGARFKDIKTLAAAINDPIPHGKVDTREYRKRYAVWSQYFEWEKATDGFRGIVITKVYRVPRTPEDLKPKKKKKTSNKKTKKRKTTTRASNTKKSTKKASNSKAPKPEKPIPVKSTPVKPKQDIFSSPRSVYQNDICRLLVHILNTHESQDHVYKISMARIMELMGLALDSYHCDPTIPYKEALDVKRKIYSGHRQAIIHGLDCLQRNKIIEYRPKEIIITQTGEAIGVTSELDMELIRSIKRRAFYKTGWASRRNRYRSIYEKLIQEATNGQWKSTYGYMDITLTDLSYLNEKYIYNEADLALAKKHLSDLFLERLDKNHVLKDCRKLILESRESAA